MRRVSVTLDAHGQEAAVHPMYDVLANGEYVDHAIALQWSYTDERLAMLHYVEGDIDAFRANAAEVPLLVDLEVVPAGRDACYAFVSCETTGAMQQLFGPLHDSTAIPVPPVTYHSDGSVSFSIVGPSAELQVAIDSVPDPLTVRVDEIGGIATIPGLVETRLSPRQRQAITAAVKHGYYAIPREATHEDVAEAIDCAPSTAAEHLRKAEATVLQSVITAESPPTASRRS